MDIRGSGHLPPLVLVHGFTAASMSQYWSLLPYLRPFFSRIIAPDLPGHGFSSMPETGICPETLVDGLAAVFDDLLLDGAVVFGSSLGGAVAARHAARTPDRLSGLILCSPAGAPLERGPQELVERFRIQSWQQALAFTDDLFPTKDEWRYVYALSLWRQFSRPHFQALLSKLSAHDFLQKEELARLSMPTLLLWGRKERILHDSGRQFFQRHLPSSAACVFPEHFGHAPFLERPAMVARLIVEFVTGMIKAPRQTTPIKTAVAR